MAPTYISDLITIKSIYSLRYRSTNEPLLERWGTELSLRPTPLWNALNYRCFFFFVCPEWAKKYFFDKKMKIENALPFPLDC